MSEPAVLDPAVVPRPAPVAVALDAPDLDTAVAWATAVGPSVEVLKVGLEVYLRDGAASVDAVRAATGRPVFLDLKLHDIPNTVAGAARSVARLRPAYLTVHAAGGAAMVAAAVQELPDTLVTAVTVLTSLSDADLERVGLRGPSVDAARRLAVLAVGAGARALVCSPHEVAAVRAEVGPAVVLVTPGVRFDAGRAGRSAGSGGSDRRPDDQARVATPEQALADGADLLVVGRPLTGAADPARAAADLASRLAVRR